MNPPMRQTSSVLNLIFVGFNSRVVAMRRDTGQIVWKWKSPKGYSSFVAVMLDGDLLIVSVQGYMYGLDPETGSTIWSNPLSGLGYGTPCIASMRANSGSAGAAAIIAQQQQAAASAGAGA